MSQEEKPHREQVEEAIKYGDVFHVSGELAKKPIAPRDAATVQSAESIALGHTQLPSALMQSAADINERRGVLPQHAVTNLTRGEGVTISKQDIAGKRVITEAIAGQVVGRYTQPQEVKFRSPTSEVPPEAITIGEALEAAARSVGDKAVEGSDAAAIEAAEIRATKQGQIMAGGAGAAAQSSAAHNARTALEDDKIKLGQILEDAKGKLTEDKAVTKEDAEGIMSAEMRNKQSQGNAQELTPGGVGESMRLASRLNHEKRNLKG